MAAPKITFRFNRTKAIETILYLANRISNSTRYNICKMLYLADKACLEKYGRFIFGESYFAMQQGAIPSKTYDLIKEIAEDYSIDFRVEGNDIIPLRDANMNYLSESDVECLDITIDTYDNSPQEMRRGAHDAAWQKAWERRGEKKSTEIPIKDIAKTLLDSQELLDYLTNRDVK